MTTHETSYWQRRLSRRTLLRGAGVSAAGLGALALTGCMGGSDSDKSAMTAPTSTAAPPKAELVIYRGRSPHLSVLDPQTGEVKRTTDIPGLRQWSWNDQENYFDGQNLWLVGFNESAAPDGSEVIVVNLDTLAVTKRIPLGPEGAGGRMLNMARTADGQVFVGKMFAGEMSVLDGKSQTLLNQKKIGEATDQACDTAFGVASDGVGRLYAATYATGRVLLLDPKTLSVQQVYAAPQGVRPAMLTVEPGGARVWVQNGFAPDFSGQRNDITLLDAKTLAVVRQIETGNPTNYAGFSPDGKIAYVTHAPGAYVSVFDTATVAEVKRLEVPMAMGVPSLAVHPDGGSIWIGIGTPAETWGVRVDTATWMMSDPIGKGPAYTGNGGFFMRRLS